MKIEDLEPGADVPETRVRAWQARFPCPCPGLSCTQVAQVNIERVSWGSDMAYYYVSEGAYHVGVWPGTASDEWIEYIPAPGLVERPDGSLWWRSYDANIDAMRYVQVTKGNEP